MDVADNLYESIMKARIDAEGPFQAAHAALDAFADGAAFDIIVNRVYSGEKRTVRIGEGEPSDGPFEVEFSYSYESNPEDVADCYADAAEQFRQNVVINKGWFVTVRHVATGTEWDIDTEETPEAYADWRDDLNETPAP